MQRILPHPILTVLLIVVWCLLVNGVSLGTVVFGTILGLSIPAATAAYWPDRPTMSRPLRMVSYMVIVIWDILVANVVVAFIVLFRSNKSMASNWVTVPLDLRSPEAITILAGTITLTPGTVSADLSDDGVALLVHALDAPDPEQTARDIKHRYERRLKEVFE